MFDHLLQENGDALLLEYSGTIASGAGDYFILLDSASAQYLWIQNTSQVEGTSYEGRMRLGAFAFTECAEMGRVGTGGFDLDESIVSAGYMPDPPALQSAIFTDFRASDVRVFSGYVHSRTTERLGHQPSGQRQWGVELVDLNTLADDFVLTESESADRPAETDYARVTWLLTVGFAPGAGVTAGQVPNTNTVTMDAIDYRGRKPREVLDQCAEVTGKNWFLYGHEGTNKLFYDLTENAPQVSTPISDDPQNIGATTFPPSDNYTVTRRPDEIYSKVHLTWAGGVVTAENTTTRDTYRRREISIIDMGVRTNTTAQAKANAFLASSAIERVTVSDLTIVVPADKVNIVHAGELITMQLQRHEITTATPYFITRRTVRSFKGSDTEYAVTLTLVNALSPTRYLYQRGSNEVWEVKSNATPDGASVIVNRDGITITEGGITVTNAGGTVIIDGTSNMFKIVASDTMTHSQGAASTGSTETTIAGSGLPTFTTPAFIAYITEGLTPAANANRNLGFFIKPRGIRPGFIANSSGGATTTSVATILWWGEAFSGTDGSGNPSITASIENGTPATTAEVYVSYHVLKESAI